MNISYNSIIFLIFYSNYIIKQNVKVSISSSKCYQLRVINYLDDWKKVFQNVFLLETLQ